MSVSEMSLEQLRKCIDECDEEIIKLLSKRQNLVKQAAVAKVENKDAAYSTERESYLLESREAMAAKVVAARACI